MQAKDWKSKLHGLYLVTPNWDDTTRLLTVTEQALQAGVNVLQYRHKTAYAALRLEQATALQTLCRQYQVPFIINDFVELCLHLDADGIHVGGTDISVMQARAFVGPDKIVGASCYGDMVLARSALQQGASYVAFGGFYPSVVKQYPVTTSPDILDSAAAEIPLPKVVIGGMTVPLARPLVERGAQLVAAISAVYNAEDVSQAVREFQDLFRYCNTTPRHEIA